MRITFRQHIIIRLVLIALLLSSAFYILSQTYFWLVSLWLLLFAGIATYSLIRKVERHKRELANFLLAISQNDFTNSNTQKNLTNLDLELQYAYNTIIDTMRDLRSESETSSQFLKTVVEHSTVAMIAYWEATGEITLLNASAKALFQKPHLKQITSLKTVDRNLYDTITTLESEEKSLVKLTQNKRLINLSISAKEIKLGGELLKLVSFQNINAELDEKELESWQKLIRVLTHEIKNSAIPISTLTEVINQLILTDGGEMRDLSQLDQEDLEDLKIGIHTVQKRSKGLVKFVNSYGELARVPTPKFSDINIAELVNDIVRLLKDDFDRNNIELDVHVPEEQIRLDPELIEQVLINTLKNAKEALNGDRAQISVGFHTQNGLKVLSVKDNGSGMDQETMDQIFIPFFTTKKEGSGIGLSLSRQIMRAHGGNLTVQSAIGEGTQVNLVF